MERGGAIALGVIADIAVAAVFFDSLWGLIPGLAAGIYVYRIAMKRVRAKRKENMTAQFRTLLLSMLGTLEAGYALENAFFSAGEDGRRVYGERCEIGEALDKLRNRLSFNMSFEEVRIIRDTAEKIVSGIELKEELSTMIAARQLEQKIMTFMPAGIILLLRLSSPGFMDMLYGSPMGIAVMSAAVGLNILADYIGKRIVGRLETE